MRWLCGHPLIFLWSIQLMHCIVWFIALCEMMSLLHSTHWSCLAWMPLNAHKERLLCIHLMFKFQTPISFLALNIQKSEIVALFLFFEELTNPQNWDEQPTVKFHRQHDAMHSYRLVSRNMHHYAVCDRERYKKPPKSDRLEWCQKWLAIQGS
jgi:hypothetical protein